MWIIFFSVKVVFYSYVDFSTPHSSDPGSGARLSLDNPLTGRPRPSRLLIDSHLRQSWAGPPSSPRPRSRPPCPTLVLSSPLTRLESLRGAEVQLDRCPSHGRRQQNNACMTRGTFSKVSLISFTHGGGDNEEAFLEKVCPESVPDRRELRKSLPRC